MPVTKREKFSMPEQNPELILNPELNKAKYNAELKTLKDRISSILVINESGNVPYYNLSSIQNITSIGVLKLLLNNLQDETNI